MFARILVSTDLAGAHSPGTVEIVQDVVFGRRADEIVRTAEDRACDLVILQHQQDSGPLLGVSATG